MVTTSASADLSVVREHRPYETALFVDRDSELETVHDKVRHAQAGGIITDPVVNFWGIRGIGKTWILRHLHYLYHYRSKPPADTPPLEYPTFALLHTFSDEEATLSLQTLARDLASEALSQLSPVLSAETRDMLLAARDSGNLQDLVKVFGKLSQRFVPLILLDGTENVSSTTWQEVELQLIEPLVLGGRVLIVVAGRRQVPRWRRFEVRRRVVESDKTQVRAFGRPAVSRQISKRSYRIPVDLLYPYTNGNPHLVDAISQNVLTWTKGAKPDRASFDKHRDGLLEILRAYEEQLLEGISAELKRILFIVSPLRFYRLESLRFMLARQDPTAAQQPDLYYLNILRALDQRTQVVWWTRERRAYATDEMVRQVINRARLLDDNADYVARHRQALEMYRQWADEYPETCEDFIVEIWFHLASMYLVDDDLSRLRSEIVRILDFARQKLAPDRLLILQKQLEGDRELLDLLPQGLRGDLLKRLERSLDHKVQ